MQPDIKRSIAGGLVGTVALTGLIAVIAPPLAGHSIDIATMMSNMLGVSYMVGMVLHFMMGTLLFPFIYVMIYRFLPGAPLMRGIIFGIMLWLGAAFVVMPMAGAGFLLANIGGMMAFLATLIAHVVYGAILGMIAGPAKV